MQKFDNVSDEILQEKIKKSQKIRSKLNHAPFKDLDVMHKKPKRETKNQKISEAWTSRSKYPNCDESIAKKLSKIRTASIKRAKNKKISNIKKVKFNQKKKV